MLLKLSELFRIMLLARFVATRGFENEICRQ